MSRAVDPLRPPTSREAAVSANPIHRVLPLVGRTPLIEVSLTWRGRRTRIFGKYEALNLTGSIKDRMAAHILGQAYEEQRIRPGDRIVEASSGNTAISFAAIGRALGHPVRIYMPEWMSAERKAILRAFGAELVDVSAADGGFVGSIRRAREDAAACPRTFEPRQFENPANADAHALTTGPEILAQLAAVGLSPDAFVAGVGTGGTVMGVGRSLRAVRPDVAVHPLEPAESPVLTTGIKTGCHRIQGISDEFVPAIVELDRLSQVVAVSDADAILMAKKLAAALGLGVGISSGANFVGALKVLDQQGPDHVVVTVFPDSNKKYLSTDLFRAETVRPGCIAPDVILHDYRAIPFPT